MPQTPQVHLLVVEQEGRQGAFSRLIPKRMVWGLRFIGLVAVGELVVVGRLVGLVGLVGVVLIG